MNPSFSRKCLCAGLLSLAASSVLATPAGPFEAVPASIQTAEDGSDVSIGFRLTAPPTDDVTLAISSNDVTEGWISASLTFTSSNWNQLQYATLSPGASGDGNDGDVMYSIDITASSVDGNFNGLSNYADVTNANSEGISAVQMDRDALIVSETGTTATISYVLTQATTDDVTLTLASSATAEGTVSPATLTFTSGNWNTPQTATVTGADDSSVDGIGSFNITTALSTTDIIYNGLTLPDLTIANLDDDASFTVSAISGDTSEDGGTATFTVVLPDAPTDDVTLNLSSDNTSEGTASPNTLTFTSANWDTPQTVTVTGVNDTLEDGDTVYNITLDAAISDDINFNGVDPADVSVTNTDNDPEDSASSDSDDSDNGWNCSLNEGGTPDGSMYLLLLLAVAHLVRQRSRQCNNV